MSKQSPLTLFGHLDELRKRLWVCVVAVAVGTAGGYFYSDQALKFFIEPIAREIGQVYFFSPSEAFVIKMKISILLGLAAAFPVLISQIWLFISPALYEKERKLVIPLIFIISVLFFAGVSFCFFVVMPPALKFLINMQTDYLKPMISITQYVGFLTTMLLAFGLAFNMPVFIMAFALVGLINVRTLNKYHRHAIVLIFIAAAVLTPGPDIASQLFLAIPLVALFEISLLGTWMIGFLKRKPKKEIQYV